MKNEYKKYFRQILKKYTSGAADKEQTEFLEAYFDVFEVKDDLIDENNESQFEDTKLSIKRKVDDEIKRKERKQEYVLRPVWIKLTAAATVLLFCSLGYYFYLAHAYKKPGDDNIALHIFPGGNKATLTLSSGQKILLDNSPKGQIAKQANISITKQTGNQIVYQAMTAGPNSNEQLPLENTITTPKGGQFSVVLPDGTKVTLNAASSLTYPASFHGSERLVQLKGEAYFEVAKNKKMPFRVKSGLQTVEVLGTHFNINSYSDESRVKTTLIEGSVKVSMPAGSAVIVPGQQAVTRSDGNGGIMKQPADIDKETAWKNGMFSFDQDDLKFVMRQIARWYDVEVVYSGDLPTEKFHGEIPRASSLADVFKILELNNIHFETNGKTVTVSTR